MPSRSRPTRSGPRSSVRPGAGAPYGVLAGRGVAVDARSFVSTQAAVVLAWLCIYAHRRLRAVLRQVRLVRI